MTSEQFQQSLTSVGISKESTATLFGVTYETVQHWNDGGKPIPPHVALGLELLIKHKIPARTGRDRAAHRAKDENSVDGRVKDGNWKMSRRS